MPRPTKLPPDVIDRWLAENPGWSKEDVARHDGDGAREALARMFTFPDFAAALAFGVRVGMAAEKRDHHPDLAIGWGKAKVLWTTHDAGGVTELDLELASTTSAFLA